MGDGGSTALGALREIWALAEGEAAALEQVTLHGADPVLPSTFRVGAAAGATVAAAGLAAAEVWRSRTGERQSVGVDLRAAAAAFRSERYFRVDGAPAYSRVGEAPRASPWSQTAGYYRTADGRWIQLHTNFAHHEAGTLEVLGCAAERSAVEEAVLGWEGESLEAALVEQGMPAGLMRSREEWGSHPQSAAVASLPLFEISPLGESPVEPLGPGDRPLSGVRVLDLTRVIAGPVCGRTLASHGAEVLRIGARHLPTLPLVWLDMAQGKRSAWLDLREPVDHARLESLVAESDVFVQGYRPGTLAARGFGPESVAQLRPGIVYVTLSAYGHVGPWAERRGYDSLVQTVSGFAEAGMQAAGVDQVSAKPTPLPCQALDHATGYLAAMGAMVGLRRRAEQGGSWLVRVSLAQTGRWLWDLGRVDGLGCADPTVEDVQDLLVRRETEEGVVSTVRPPVEMSSTGARWEREARSLGRDQPVWAPQARLL